jgi:hypothetical protein
MAHSTIAAATVEAGDVLDTGATVTLVTVRGDGMINVSASVDGNTLGTLRVFAPDAPVRIWE